MKRDKELCMNILQFIEENQTLYEPFISDNIRIEGYTTDQIVYHLDLLEDDMYIKIESMSTLNNSWRGVKMITSAGHDVLDSVKE
jgi:hypothetical protein